MPKVPEVPHKPPHRGRKRMTTQSEQMLFMAAFDRKIVVSKWSPRWYHVLVGEKTFCGLKKNNVRVVSDNDYKDTWGCSRCKKALHKVKDMMGITGNNEAV